MRPTQTKYDDSKDTDMHTEKVKELKRSILMGGRNKLAEIGRSFPTRFY